MNEWYIVVVGRDGKSRVFDSGFGGWGCWFWGMGCGGGRLVDGRVGFGMVDIVMFDVVFFVGVGRFSGRDFGEMVENSRMVVFGLYSYFVSFVVEVDGVFY